MRANADGSRIHVLDSGGEDVTIWTPDGTLIRPAGHENPEIWYAVRKGVVRGTIRRIVVPESLRPRDVSDTHLWGTRQDEMDVQYVVGLRLVPTEESSP